ncbi:heat shock cognate 70 kDa protein [Spatholobus suberectus]|nr:heat shock cognate 70 kDa protein [Spatholobus suberectus]
MATGPERSKPLHNFSLPCLKWGTQRLLRCVNADLDRRSPKFDAPQNDAARVPKRKNDDTLVVAGEEAAGVVANNNAMMPWNLRTRRAACKAPQNEEERRFFDTGCSSPVKEKKKVPVVVGNNERVKFSVSLSKEEVEQDFWALAGTRPPRRPKKRPRIVQRQLNTLFPGLWLAEVTAEAYKVADVLNEVNFGDSFSFLYLCNCSCEFQFGI